MKSGTVRGGRSLSTRRIPTKGFRVISLHLILLSQALLGAIPSTHAYFLTHIEKRKFIERYREATAHGLWDLTDERPSATMRLTIPDEVIQLEEKVISESLVLSTGSSSPLISLSW